ncbi:zinc finger protein 54-like [Symsagittifera roscoffensis]|uniref:zinc finger protein 54-like n=1 Tax=Symsagittifera roscoffensis TaxID=84072 RepID=UPI00307B9E3F
MEKKLRQYICSVCKRMFARESALVNHTNMVHPMKEEEGTLKPSIQKKTSYISKFKTEISKVSSKSRKGKVVKKLKTNMKMSSKNSSNQTQGKDKFIPSKFLQIAKRRKVISGISNSQKMKKKRRVASTVSVDSETTLLRTGTPVKKCQKKEEHFNAALQFGFKSVQEMFSRSGVKLQMERINVPEKLWPVIEEIESQFKRHSPDSKTERTRKKTFKVTELLGRFKSTQLDGQKRGRHSLEVEEKDSKRPKLDIETIEDNEDRIESFCPSKKLIPVLKRCDLSFGVPEVKAVEITTSSLRVVRKPKKFIEEQLDTPTRNPISSNQKVQFGKSRTPKKAVEARSSIATQELSPFGSEKHWCSVCNRVFSRLAALEKHTKNDHNSPLVSKTNSAQFTEKNRKRRRRSESSPEKIKSSPSSREQTERRRFKARLENKFNLMDRARREKAKKRGFVSSTEFEEESFRTFCETCNQRFSSLNSKKQHMIKVHGPEWRHLCVVCCKIFPDRGMLLRHQIIHKIFEESMTEQSEETVNLDQDNLETILTPLKSVSVFDRLQMAEKIPSVFEDKILDFNQASEPLDPQKEVMLYTNMESIKCIFCGEKFPDLFSLNSHIQKCPVKSAFPDTHEVKESDDKEESKENTDDSHLYKHSCEYCFKVYSTEDKMLDHQKNSCSNFGILRAEAKNVVEQPVRLKFSRCEFCHKKFGSRSAMKLHQQLHFKDKRFACEFCGLGFGDNSDLARHRLEHNYDAEFKCFVCSRMFLDTEELLRHETLHRQTNSLFCSLKLLGHTTLEQTEQSESAASSIQLVDLGPIVEDLVARKWREVQYAY